jgi:hypothetical protein
VLIGILESYIERVGSASGITRPASVGFRTNFIMQVLIL